jgi:predicted DNA-binding antitoxin AbrB/MazE fold protein
MPITVEAIFENGVLKRTQPLPLKEQTKVRLTVEPQYSSLSAAYGLMGWKGDAETLERIALDPEFILEESS